MGARSRSVFSHIPALNSAAEKKSEDPISPTCGRPLSLCVFPYPRHLFFFLQHLLQLLWPLELDLRLGAEPHLVEECDEPLVPEKHRLKCEIWEKWGATYGRNGCGGRNLTIILSFCLGVRSPCRTSATSTRSSGGGGDCAIGSIAHAMPSGTSAPCAAADGDLPSGELCGRRDGELNAGIWEKHRARAGDHIWEKRGLPFFFSC